jgi:hypothetical protein
MNLSSNLVPLFIPFEKLPFAQSESDYLKLLSDPTAPLWRGSFTLAKLQFLQEQKDSDFCCFLKRFRWIQ